MNFLVITMNKELNQIRENRRKRRQTSLLYQRIHHPLMIYIQGYTFQDFYICICRTPKRIKTHS